MTFKSGSSQNGRFQERLRGWELSFQNGRVKAYAFMLLIIGGIADLPLNRKLLAICQKSKEPSFWEVINSLVLLPYAILGASRTLLQGLIACLNFTLDSEDLFCWYKLKKWLVFPPLGNEDHVVSVSILFPSNSQWDAPFHHIAYDHFHADWDGLNDHLRDVPWEDIFKLSVSAAASDLQKFTKKATQVVLW